MKGKSKGKDMSRPRGNSIVPVDSDEEVSHLPVPTWNHRIFDLGPS